MKHSIKTTNEKNLNLPNKILFCDFNGVISYDRFWHTLQNPTHELNKFYEPIRNVYLNPDLDIAKRWMLGELTTEQVHTILCQSTGAPYEEIIKIFENECRNIDISTKICNKILELQSKYYCILSTGNMDSLDRFTIPSNPILNESFNRIDNSFNIKSFKTTNKGQYFTDAASNLNIAIENCIVIDDGKKICDTFSALGGKSFLVTGEELVMEVLNNL